MIWEMLRRYIDTQVHFGRATKVGNLELTPYSRATIVHIPGPTGGLVWNRPAGVLVKNENGDETALPIRDETRIAQVALIGMGLIGAAIAWLVLGRRS